jgi:hypothetical protein
MNKRENNAIKLLETLRDGRWHTTHSLSQRAGLRFGARLHELRARWRIDVVKRSTGEDTWEYRWVDVESIKQSVISAAREVGALKQPQPIEARQLALVD